MVINEQNISGKTEQKGVEQEFVIVTVMSLCKKFQADMGGKINRTVQYQSVVQWFEIFVPSRSRSPKLNPSSSLRQGKSK